MSLYSVLTYNFNNYEIIREVEEKDPDAEYIMVTDDKTLSSKTWTVIYDKDLDGLSVFDKCYAVRFNVWKYIHTDVCIRIDGSIKICKSLRNLYDKFIDGGYDACLMVHPYRNNLIDEYNEWIRYRQYPRDYASKILGFMSSEGYDFNYKGIFQLCFAITKKNKLNEDIDRFTYTLLKYFGTDESIERLDQTVYTFVVNKYFNNMNVLPVSERIIHSEYMTWMLHGQPTIHNFAPGEIEPYMFNKKITYTFI